MIQRWLPVVALLMAGMVMVADRTPMAELPSYTTVQLPNASGGTEPRVAVDPMGHLFTITNSGQAVVYESTDHGRTWLVAGRPAGQVAPTIDVEIVATRTGRLIASELDDAVLSFKTSYSDDSGKTWKQSVFSDLIDQDRQFMAVGPDDATTHQPRVYLLFHNLASGAVSHNMYVETSTDGGATFGAAIPLTLPSTQAWLDLQCSDSGGPSSLFVDRHSGAVYATWGTRSSVAGGCGASATGSFEINVVGATRVWVAGSPDGSAGSWTDSLAVDDNATGQLVGMQESPGTVDSAGNVYVFYPESIHAYPDYNGAALKYVWSKPGLGKWSAPVTVEPGGQPGHILAHVIAGDPGKLDFAYYAGVMRDDGTIFWYTRVAQTLNGLGAQPTFTETQVSTIPAYSGTASLLMGACGSGPTQGVENGFACNRSTDVWGISLDLQCNVVVAWPTLKVSADRKSMAGTFVTTQTGGPRICESSPAR